jgi:hypothetical protein
MAADSGKSDDPGSREPWSVYRIDDNGNRFLVESNLSQEAAGRLVADMGARGHKQGYWMEQEPKPG